MLRSRSLRTGAVAAALAATLLLAAGAQAAGFTASAPFPADTTSWTDTLPGFTGDGTMVAGHVDILSTVPPIASKLTFSRRAPGQAWTTEFTMPSTAADIPASPPQLDVAADGSAVAIWIAFDGPDPASAAILVKAAVRSPAGAWDAPVTLESVPQSPSGGLDIAATIAPDGTATVIYGHYLTPLAVSPVEQLDAVTHGSGGWSAPVHVSPAAHNSGNVVVGVDDTGAVTVAWRQQFAGEPTPSTGDDKYKLDSSVRYPGGLWSTPVDVFPFGTSHWSEPHLAVGPDGRAIMAAQSSIPPIHVFAAVRDNGTWAPAQQVVTSGASSYPLAVGMAPNGTAYVLYNHQGSIDDNVGLIRAAPNAPWSAPAAVSSLGSLGDRGAIAFSGSDAVAAWQPNGGGVFGIQATRWAATSVAADPFTPLQTAPQELDAAISDRNGSVLILAHDPSTQLQQRFVYDAGAPALRSSNVPATATGLSPYHASVSFGDLWSSLADPSWSFGDGTPAVTGSNVTHTFAVPGAYTITVHSADVLGNARDVTFPVSVAKDPYPPAVTISRPTCAKKFSAARCRKFRARRSAWRTLHGTAADLSPTSGITAVKVTAYRKTGHRYLAFVGTQLKNVSRKKALASTHDAILTATGRWTLKLPNLQRGTWTFLARAVDGAGNHTKHPAAKIVALR